MDEPLKGVVADVPTPRNTDGSINFDIIQVIVDRMIHAGISAILVAGKVGEDGTFSSRFIPDKGEYSSNSSKGKCSLDYSEYEQVVKAYLQAAKGKIRIIAGIPKLPHDYLRRWWRGYQDLGCYAVIFMNTCIGQKFFFLSEEHEDMHTPLLYFVCELNSFEDVAYGNNLRFDEQYFTKFITRVQTEEDRKFNGKDSLCFTALSLGSPGIITGMAAILPYHCVEFYRTLTIEKNLEKARLQWKFLRELAILLEKGDYSANVKAAMRFIGIDTELNKDENDGICSSTDLAPLRTLLERRTNVHFDNDHI